MEEAPSMHNKTKAAVSRKRPFEHVDSSTHEEEEEEEEEEAEAEEGEEQLGRRPRKKARVWLDAVHALVFPELYDGNDDDDDDDDQKQEFKKPQLESGTTTLDDKPDRFTVFPKSSTSRKAKGQTISQRFLSQIRHRMVSEQDDDIS